MPYADKEKRAAVNRTSVRRVDEQQSEEHAAVRRYLADQGITIPCLTNLTHTELDALEGTIERARQALGLECLASPDTSSD